MIPTSEGGFLIYVGARLVENGSGCGEGDGPHGKRRRKQNRKSQTWGVQSVVVNKPTTTTNNEKKIYCTYVDEKEEREKKKRRPVTFTTAMCFDGIELAII